MRGRGSRPGCKGRQGDGRCSCMLGAASRSVRRRPVLASGVDDASRAGRLVLGCYGVSGLVLCTRGLGGGYLGGSVVPVWRFFKLS